MVANPYGWSQIELGVFQLLNTNYQVGLSDVKGWVLNAQRPFSTVASLRWWPIWSTHKHTLPFICFVLVSCSSGSLYSHELYLIDHISTGGLPQTALLPGSLVPDFLALWQFAWSTLSCPYFTKSSLIYCISGKEHRASEERMSSSADNGFLITPTLICMLRHTRGVFAG